MVQKLLAVESPEEPTEIVIHVNMLKEGWDVTNLYTIVPLRAANARTLIEQSIGRGLRLPYGRRTGVSTVDRLNIIAHDRFQEIVDEAIIRSDPNRTLIPGFIVDAVCHVPFASHPSYSQGYYDRDNEFYLAWDKVSESAEATKQYLDEWVYSVKDREEYWEKLGAKVHKRLKVKAKYNDGMPSRYQPAQTRLRKFEEAAVPGSASKTTVTLLASPIGLGDLNGDGAGDAEDALGRAGGAAGRAARDAALVRRNTALPAAARGACRSPCAAGGRRSPRRAGSAAGRRCRGTRCRTCRGTRAP